MKLNRKICIILTLLLALIISSCTSVETSLEAGETVYIDIKANVEGVKESVLADDLIEAQKAAKVNDNKVGLRDDLKATKKVFYEIKTRLSDILSNDFSSILVDGLKSKGLTVIDQDNARYRLEVNIDLHHDRSKVQSSVEYEVSARLVDTSHVRRDELQGVELEDYDNFIKLPDTIDTLDHFATDTWSCSGCAYGDTEADALNSALETIEKEYLEFLSFV